MKASKLFLILFSITVVNFAQSIGTWKVYSDLKGVKGTSIVNGEIWAATTGGIFKTGTSDTTITSYSKADGFASQNYYATTNDANGNVWFGSSEGFVNIFNPQTSSIDLIVDFFNTGKSKKAVNDLSISGDTIFASLDFGLSMISASKKTLMDSFLKLGNLPAEAQVISALKNKLIYVCTQLGIAIQKEGATNLAAPESWNSYKYNTELPFSSATKFGSFNSNVILGTSSGVFQYQNNAWSLLTLKDVSIVSLGTSGSNLYAITKSQLYQYSNNQLKKLYENTDCIFSSLTVTNSAIYISSNIGIIEYKNGTTRIIAPNSPNGTSFVNMSVSPIDGSLWVATGKDLNGKGFFKFDGNKWKIYNHANTPSLKTDAFYSITAASDSAIYAGNWGNGAIKLKNNKIDTFTVRNTNFIGIPDNSNFLVISDIKVDSKGNAWFLNYLSKINQPLSAYTKDKKWYHFPMNYLSSVSTDNFDKLVIDPYDTKWFLCINGERGIYYYNENGTLGNTNDDNEGLINTSDGLLSELVNCIAVDRGGQIWIGTNVGITMIPDPTRPKYSLFSSTSTAAFGRSLRNQNINCIAIDPINQKWFGTSNGVFVLSSDGYQLVNYYDTKNSPLPDNNILSIAIDPKSGKVYFGTDYGLAELKTEFVQPKESFDKILTYPNPFVLGNGETNYITIDGLIRNSNIKIINISGDLVKEITSVGGRVATWDGKDEKGNLVASGIYILVANDNEANNVSTAKIAIIRK